MSSKTWIVAQREFAVRVKKRSFIIMTVLMPFLMAALVLLPLFLSMLDSDERKTVAVIDSTGRYVEAFESNEKYLFVPTEKMTGALRSDSTETAAVLQITDNLVDRPGSAVIYSRDEVPMDLRDYVDEVLTGEVRREKLERYRIPELDRIIDDVKTPVEVQAVRWTDDGERESMAEILSGIGMLLTFLIYFFVMTYGATVMQSIIEEKVNRIVEVMVSSVKPVQLLIGKIVGVGFVGLLQMLIWGLLLGVILMVASGIADIPVADDSTGVAASALLEVVASLPIFEICVLFVLYFIGGYLLYASILSASGAAVNDMQDSQQFMLPVLVLMMFAFYAGFYSAMNPDGPLAFWCSFIPFTSPIVMMVRIPFGLPVWQEILSVGLLYLSAAAVMLLSAKIYRVGILMYGKKPSFKEMLKWLRY